MSRNAESTRDTDGGVRPRTREAIVDYFYSRVDSRWKVVAVGVSTGGARRPD
jgi:hypothetical protein